MKRALLKDNGRRFAMRVLVMVVKENQRDPDFLMGDLAQRIVADFGLSKSSAYRYLCDAAEVLGIRYKISPSRAAKAREKRKRGMRKAATLKRLGYA